MGYVAGGIKLRRIKKKSAMDHTDYGSWSANNTVSVQICGVVWMAGSSKLQGLMSSRVAFTKSRTLASRPTFLRPCLSQQTELSPTRTSLLHVHLSASLLSPPQIQQTSISRYTNCSAFSRQLPWQSSCRVPFLLCHLHL